jgi:hypothetical protein
MPASVRGLRGTASFSWTGVPADQLALDSATGAVKGQPTQSATYPGVRVTVTDSADGAVATAGPFQVQVLPASAQVPFTAGPFAASYPGTVGIPLALRATANGNKGAVTWSTETPLPTWLSLDPSTGLISGTPPEVASHPVTGLVATDTDGTRTPPASFSVVVGPAGSLAISAGPYTAIQDEAFASPAPGVTNAVGNATYSLASGKLPEGLALEAQTGIVSGKPTVVGDYDGIVLSATDEAGATATTTPFTVTVVPGQQSTNAASASMPSSTGRLGEPFSVSPSTDNLSGPFTWTLARGDLPAWLHLDAATGTLAGTPQEATFATGLALKVSGADGAARTNAFSVTAVENPVLAASMGGFTAILGRSASAIPVVSGAVGAQDWRLTSGGLPDGLSIDPVTGRIHGTPTTPGTSEGLEVTVTDSANATASTGPFSITVTPAPTLDASISSPLFGYAGYTFSGGPGFSGAQGDVRWALSAGSLPTGLGLDPASGRISGTPQTTGRTAGLVLTAVDASGASAKTNAFEIAVGSFGTGNPGGSTGGGSGNTGGSTGGGSTGGGTGGTGGGPGGTGSGSTGGGSGGTGGSTGGSTGAPPIAPNGAPVTVGTGSSLYISGISGRYYATLNRQFRTSPPSVTGARGTVAFGLSGNVPGWLTVDGNHGAMSGIPTELGSFGPVYLQAVDGYGSATVGPFFIDVSRPGLNAYGPSGRLYVHVGSSLTTSTPTTSGALGPVTWSVASALPQGLSASPATGVVSGVVTAGGTTSGIVLTARDTSDGTTAQTPAFAIDAAGPLSVSTSQVYPAKQSFAFTANPSAANALGRLTWRVSSGTLPGWLSLDPATGRLSGTPGPIATTSGLALTVTDATGASATSQPFSVKVGWGLVAGVTSGRYAGRASVPLATEQPYATGANGAVTWTIASGTLPSWARLNAGTGVIAGTPPGPSTTTLSLRAKDSRGDVADTPTFQIAVGPGPEIAIPAPAPVRVGAPFSHAPQVTGAYGNQAWRLATGTLPAGLSLDPTSGRIHGRPSASALGTASGLSLAVRDDDGATATSGSFAIAVTQGISVTNLKPSYGGRANTAFSMPPLGASNALGAIAWGVTGHPPGLSLAGSALTGTPPRSYGGQATFTATDASDGAIATGIAGIVIAPGMQVTASPPDVSIHAGQGFSTLAPSIAGQRGSTLAWEIHSGAKPPNATLSAGTGMLSSPREDTVASYLGLRLKVTDPVDSQTAITEPFSVNVLDRPAVTQVPTFYTARFDGDLRTSPPTLLNAIGAVKWTWGATGTPPSWATVDAATGSVTGKPNVLTTTPNLTIVGTDATGIPATSVPFGLRVFSQPIVSIAPTTTTYRTRVGDAFTVTPSASGIAGTRGWSLDVKTGSLPAGIRFDEATGRVYGPATGTGAVSFSIVVKDSEDGATAPSPVVSLSVTPSLQMSGLASSYAVHVGDFLTTGTPQVMGSQTPGGVNYALSIPVPTGMNPFDPRVGILSGAPTAALSSRSVTLTATDAWDGRTSTQSFTLAILPALSWQTQAGSMQSILVGDTVSMTPVAANVLGTARYTLLKDGAPAPDALSGCGLSLAANGAVSGKVTGICNVTGLRIRVADDGTATVDTNEFSVRSSTPSVTLGASAATVTEGSTQSVVASSNIGGVKWTLAGAPSGSSVTTAGVVSLIAPDVDADTTYDVTITGTSGVLTDSKSFALTVRPGTATLGQMLPVRSGYQAKATYATTLNGGNATWSFSSSPASGSAFSQSGGTFTATAPTYNGPDLSTTVTVNATATAYTPSSATPGKASATASYSLYRSLAFAEPITSANGKAGEFLSWSPPRVDGLIGAPYYEIVRYENFVVNNVITGGFRPLDLSKFCPGLSIDPLTGTLSGTPSGYCNLSPVNIRLSDSAGPLNDNGARGLAITIVSQNFALSVQSATVTPSQASLSVQEGQRVAFTTTTSLRNPTYSLVGAPAWIRIDPVSGDVSSISPDVGTSGASYAFKVQATGSGATTQADMQVYVSSATSAMVTTTARQGKPFAMTTTSNLPDSTVTSIRAGSNYVGGLAYEGSTTSGTVTGTAMEGLGANVVNDTVTLTRTSANVPLSGGAASVSPSAYVSVYPHLTVTMPSTGSGIAGSPFSWSSTAVGNRIGTVRYALLSGGTDVSDTLGSLCKGLYFDRSNSAIAGVPTSSCSLNLTLSVTDNGGAYPQASDTVTKDLTITVTEATLTPSAANVSVVEGSLLQFHVTTSLPDGASYAMTGQPDWMAINPNGKVAFVSVYPPMVTKDETYPLTITSQYGTVKATTQVTVTVLASRITMSPVSVRALEAFSARTTVAPDFVGAWIAAAPGAGTVTMTGGSGNYSATGTAPANTGSDPVTYNISAFKYATNWPGTPYNRGNTDDGATTLTVYPRTSIANLANQDLRSGTSLNLASPTPRGVFGTLTYGLYRSGSAAPNALAGCNATFDPATGAFSSPGLTDCNVTNLHVIAFDTGGPVPAGQASTEYFSFKVAPVFAFSGHPGSQSLAPGETANFTATVTGAPTGSLTPAILGADGTTAGVPAWLTASCAGTTCTLRASPPSSVATGVYPTTGSFRLKLTDGAANTATSNGFTVTARTIQGGFQVFTSNGTFTPQKPGMTVRVLAIGGGSAGGASFTCYIANGGMAGGSGYYKASTVTVATSATVSVGSFGRPTTCTQSTQAGGPSVFYAGSTTITANGGEGAYNPSRGGSAGGANYTMPGGWGTTPGGSAGSSTAGPTLNGYKTEFYGTGQGTVPDLTQFKRLNLSWGSGGNGASGCSIPGAGGGGGLVIPGYTAKAGDATGPCPGSGGNGFGAGGGGGSNMQGAIGSNGAGGVVYVEWDDQ